MEKLLFFFIGCFCLLSFSNGRLVPDDGGTPPVRAVNLGGWLVIEGWIRPSLLDDIPNNDLLDGAAVRFRSVTTGKYLSAVNGGGTIIAANKTTPSEWETFRLWRINKTTFNFRLSNYKHFVGLNTAGNGIEVVAIVSTTPGVTETFEIQRNPNDSARVRIKAPNGMFLQVMTEELVIANYDGNGGWGDDDPSNFLLTILGGNDRLEGEYQVTNGYGPLLAQKVMKEHWSTFIVEKDFQFIKNNGLNAVRIPVGWWIAHDPNPPKPFVGGSLQALDNAFSWLSSQNGWQHSGTRDGSQEWGQTDETIQQTVDVIDFLTARPSLLAMQLINEPLSPGVSLDTLIKFYRAGYDAVRKHSTTAYVMLSNRLGEDPKPRELFNFANGLTKIVIDIHCYNLFNDFFDSLTVQQHIDYVYINRTAQLNEITTSNGPLTFVGEWVAELPPVIHPTKESLQKFAKAQLEVFGRATFGWAIWGLKNFKVNHWSLEWMINNGYIKFK